MSGLERFAYPVRDLEELAPPIRSALAAQLLPGEAMQQIIFAPRQDQYAARGWLGKWLSLRFFWQRTPDWVLALTGERLLVATIPEASGPPRVSVAPLADLLWLELGTILLYSWFAWSWASGGQPQQQRVYFNTVRDDLFWQIVNTIRRTIIAQSGLPRSEGERHLEVFAGLPYKFRNLVPHRLMLPGEQVQAMVYQPAVWGRRLGIFDYQRAPATVVVLSPEHLLVAQDDVTNLRVAYGLIARYCPRSRLRRAALEEIEGDLWLNVTLGMGESEETLRYRFAPEAEPALRDLTGVMFGEETVPGANT